MKKIHLLTILITATTNLNAQKIYTSDIDNFWKAYDEIHTIKVNKIEIFKTKYLDNGTIGLKNFANSKEFNEVNYVSAFEKYPNFWKTIRPNTIISEKRIKKIHQALKRFNQLYPNQSKGNIYFTIGALRSGGMPYNADLILGLEKIMGDKTTNTSEFENPTMQNMFKFSNPALLEFVTIHEYIHTFQKGGEINILAKSIKEGSADFISELTLKEKYNSHYLDYGYKHYDSIQLQFKTEMLTKHFQNWFYNSENTPHPDLGYFVGYDISKKYYQNSINKKQAINELINLNYDNEQTVLNILSKSQYFKENINIEELKKSYKNNQPHIVKIIEFENGTENISTNLKQLQIVFSKPMNDKISINFSKNGKEYFPLNKITGLNEDKTILSLELIALKPNTTYDFYITNRSTIAIDGYPFIDDEYIIEFRTAK